MRKFQFAAITLQHKNRYEVKVEEAMNRIGMSKCPYLKGTFEDALCSIRNNFVKDMVDVNIRLCMSRRYEACYIYFEALQKMIVERIFPETAHVENAMNIMEI